MQLAGGNGGTGGSFIAAPGRGRDGGPDGQLLLLDATSKIGLRLNGSETLVNGSRVVINARATLDLVACATGDDSTPPNLPCSGLSIDELGRVSVLGSSGLNLTAGFQPPPELRVR